MADDDVSRARALLETGRNAEAARLLAQAIAGAPGALEPRCLMAQAQIQLGDFAAALELANGAIGIAPHDDWPLRLRAVALQRLDRPQQATATAMEAVRTAPSSRRTHTLLSDCFLDEGNYAGAEHEAWEAARLAPNDAGPQVLLSRIALRRRDWEAAEDACRQALQRDPHNAAAVSNLGAAYLGRRRPLAAMNQFLAALRIDPQMQVPLRNLGYCVRYVVVLGVVVSLVLTRFNPWAGLAGVAIALGMLLAMAWRAPRGALWAGTRAAWRHRGRRRRPREER